jgi:hypothetical protein
MTNSNAVRNAGAHRARGVTDDDGHMCIYLARGKKLEIQLLQEFITTGCGVMYSGQEFTFRSSLREQ